MSSTLCDKNILSFSIKTCQLLTLFVFDTHYIMHHYYTCLHFFMHLKVNPWAQTHLRSENQSLKFPLHHHLPIFSKFSWGCNFSSLRYHKKNSANRWSYKLLFRATTGSSILSHLAGRRSRGSLARHSVSRSFSNLAASFILNCVWAETPKPLHVNKKWCL